MVYQRIRARLKEKGRANIRELDKAVKIRIEQYAAKARVHKRPVEEVDIAALKRSAQKIIDSESVLELFANEHEKLYVGERKNAKLLYLIMTSRLFELQDTMNGIVKGPSAVGKSWAAQHSGAVHVAGKYLPFTSLSEKALLYLPEDSDLKHKILIMAEVPKDDQQQQFQKSIAARVDVRRRAQPPYRDEGGRDHAGH